MTLKVKMGARSIEPVLCACLCQPFIASLCVCAGVHMFTHEANLEYYHLARLGGQLVLKSPSVSPSTMGITGASGFLKLFDDFYV